MSTSLIIPAYNEEKRLPPFLDSLASFLAEYPDMLSEIIVVNDGSTDGTASVVSAYTKKLPSMKFLSLEKNQGKGAAVQAGVLASTGDYIVFIDADGATGPSELPRMIEALQTADVVVGNRFLPGAQTERHSLLRQLSGFTYRTYMKLFGMGNIDTMCGFKGYTRAVALDLFTNLLEKRWLFDTEVAYKATIRGYTIVNIPIRWESKDGSKLPTRTLIASAFQIWPLIQRIKKMEVSFS